VPKQPYIPWFAEDFLTGVMDLSAEQTGVYTIILCLIADKDSPIDADYAWLGRRCNTSTRKARDIVEALVKLGKLEIRNGLIGNKRMLHELANRRKKSAHASRAAQEKWRLWRSENKPQLPFDEKNFGAPEGKTAGKSARKSPEKPREKVAEKPVVFSEKNTDQISQISQNSANPDANMHSVGHSFLARDRDSSNKLNNQPISSTITARASDAPSVGWLVDKEKDLGHLLETVSAVAGYVPRGANGYAEAANLIREWRDHGIDFEATVLPVIERTVATSAEPTNSLKRFDRAIRHEHAKARAQKNLPDTKPLPPREPILSYKDEIARVAELRKAVFDKIGATRYIASFNHARIEQILNGRDRPVLRLSKRAPFHVDEFNSRETLKPFAKAMGWDEVW
jgi:uncharacterized protein YdaU (DUF1376 family)